MPLLVPSPELLTLLRSLKHVLLIGHREPDADTIFTSLALASYLRSAGTDVGLYNVGPFERREVMPVKDLFASTVEPADRARPRTGVIVLDCSTIDRIDALADAINGLPTIVIDHHSAGVPFGDFRFVDPSASATAVLIVRLFEALGHRPTQEQAEYLLFALVTDTGFFRHIEGGDGETFRVAKALVDAGASPRATYERMFGGTSLPSRKLIAKLISRIESVCGDRFLITYETLADTADVGKEHRDSDAFYQLMQTIDGYQALALLREETADSCTGSLRSVGDIDVGAIARRFGGGGHIHAAGFLAKRPWADVYAELVQLFRTIVCVDDGRGDVAATPGADPGAADRSS